MSNNNQGKSQDFIRNSQNAAHNKLGKKAAQVKTTGCQKPRHTERNK